MGLDGFEPFSIAEFRATTKAKAQLSALTASVHAELAALRKEQVAAAMQFLIYRRPEVGRAASIGWFKMHVVQDC